MTNSKDLFYDRIADDFDSIMNMYDTNRRVEVIFQNFLRDIELSGKKVLDAGCGTGWFSKEIEKRKGDVHSIDISPRLVEITKRKCPASHASVASILSLPFDNNAFDVVISSDVIEHTDNPLKAVDELIRVLKPNGLLCITVPNKSFWYFSVVIANKLKLRKYQGNENWLHYYSLKRYLQNHNVDILDYKGIHLFPFVLNFLNPLLKVLDRAFEHRLGFLMVNIAAYGRKR